MADNELIAQLNENIIKLINVLASPFYFQDTFVGPDTTERHPVKFINIHDGKHFMSHHIRIKTPSTNTSDVEYSFEITGKLETLPRGNTFIMDGKAEHTIYVKFGTTGDSLKITAW